MPPLYAINNIDKVKNNGIKYKDIGLFNINI